jgi:hypothetical protein
MTTSQVYWLTRLDNLNTFLIIMACLAGLALILVPFAWMMADVDDNATGKGFATGSAKWSPLVLVGSLAGSVFIPSTKELIAIYGISYLTQNKDAREIPAEALKVLNQKLKEMESE